MENFDTDEKPIKPEEQEDGRMLTPEEKDDEIKRRLENDEWREQK